MFICFCKEKSFWNIFPNWISGRKQLVINYISIFFNNFFNLSWIYNTSINISFCVIFCLILNYRNFFSSSFIYLVDFLFIFDFTTIFRNFRFNSVNTRRNIYSCNIRLIYRILKSRLVFISCDLLTIKKSISLRSWSCC